MSTPPRLCLFCSTEKRYERLYKTVRTHYPDMFIVAVLRNGIQLTEVERELVNEVRELDLASFSVTRMGGLVRMLRMLRQERFDELIILFDSLKLRVLCAFSGASQCICWKEDGRLVTIPSSFLVSMAQVGRLRAIGYWKLTRVWLALRFKPVRPRTGR